MKQQNLQGQGYYNKPQQQSRLETALQCLAFHHMTQECTSSDGIVLNFSLWGYYCTYTLYCIHFCCTKLCFSSFHVGKYSWFKMPVTYRGSCCQEYMYYMCIVTILLYSVTQTIKVVITLLFLPTDTTWWPTKYTSVSVVVWYHLWPSTCSRTCHSHSTRMLLVLH